MNPEAVFWVAKQIIRTQFYTKMQMRNKKIVDKHKNTNISHSLNLRSKIINFFVKKRYLSKICLKTLPNLG